jgi:DNA-binding LytR/AlgR family response regulator
MRFRIQIDPDGEEEVLAVVHRHTEFVDSLEALVLGREADRIIGYREEEWRELLFRDIECILVQEDRTYAIDSRGERYLLKARLYEVEKLLPDSFFRINKSAIANRDRIERFTAAFNGAVDVTFQCGYQDYVSRRCFRAIKERMGIK